MFFLWFEHRYLAVRSTGSFTSVSPNVSSGLMPGVGLMVMAVTVPPTILLSMMVHLLLSDYSKPTMSCGCSVKTRTLCPSR